MAAYSDCGKRWQFKYVHRLPEKSKLAMKIGSTNHAILESVNHWIKEKKTEPDKDYYHKEIEQLVKLTLPVDLFSEIKKTSKADIALSDEEFQHKQRNATIEQLRKMCNMYIDKANEKFKEVLLIEAGHILEINKIPFKMYMDLVVRFKDGSLRILDYKTKAKVSADVAILQLVAYAVGVEDMLKEKVGALEQWDFIKKTEPEIVVHQVDMTMIDSYKKVLSEELPSFWTGVNSGMFPRNMRSMFCGPDKCDYWNVCMQPGKLEETQKSMADFHGDTVKNLEQRRR
jgi:hypothetical protein